MTDLNKSSQCTISSTRASPILSTVYFDSSSLFHFSTVICNHACFFFYLNMPHHKSILSYPSHISSNPINKAEQTPPNSTHQNF